MKRFILSLGCLVFLICFQSKAQKGNTFVLIETNKGNIKIKLYDETPKHRDNFIKLVKEKFYDSLLFHRVINEFMIQAGDPNSKNAPKGTMLGNGDPSYKIPAEFNTSLFHKKGAIAAARTGDDVNPAKESSGSQFYIVQGKILNNEELKKIEDYIVNQKKSNRIREYIFAPENSEKLNQIREFKKSGQNAKIDSIIKQVGVIIESKYKNEIPFKFSKSQIDVYTKIGGTPFLDMNYTVFGEVVEGLEIVDNIAKVQVDSNNRPQDDVVIKKMTLVKK